MKGRWVHIASLALVVFVGVLLTSRMRVVTAEEATEPSIIKPSIVVNTNREIVWHDAPKGDEQWDIWKWTPKIKFSFNGPMPAGSQLYCEFTLPGNKPWIKFDCETPELTADQWGWVEANISPKEGNGSTATGLLDFKIKVRNEVAGTDKTLFTGKINVKKFHVGNNLPKFKDNFLFYVDYDWNLPIGYVYYPQPIHHPAGGTDYDDCAPLRVAMWFAGSSDQAAPDAYLLYQGKEIANTRNNEKGHVSDEEHISTPEISDHDYRQYSFSFTRVLAFDKRENPGADWFHLDKNPGEYEVKVLVRNHLARTAKFTVGQDGKVVDNGIGTKNKLGTLRTVLPVKILGNEDGQWDQNAWKTVAFFGNPLEGFVAP